MTDIIVIRCDGCRKETKNSTGWIHIGNTEDYSVDIIGEGDDFLPIATESLDFCSPRCLCRWIKREYEGAGGKA